MPQVMIGLSARDYRIANDVWRLAKRHLNPAVRRRIGWRGRSSFLRELMLFGFERASDDPGAFLRAVREAHDPLLGRHARTEAGADRREAMIGAWQGFFPSAKPAARPARRPRPAEPTG